MKYKKMVRLHFKEKIRKNIDNWCGYIYNKIKTYPLEILRRKRGDDEMHENRGITLIILVVSIIVLLILAGVSVALLTGKNGLIIQTVSAKKETELSNEKEKIKLSYVQAKANKIGEKVTKQDLQKELDTNMQANSTKVYKEDEKLVVNIINTDRYYDIDTNGNVQQIKTKLIIDKNPGNITIGMNGEKLTGENEENAYEIWCIEDLLEWSKNYSQYKSSYIKLCRNLNFQSELSYANAENTTSYEDYNGDGVTEVLINELTNENGRGFIPITAFKGIFDGQNYEISKVFIKNNSGSSAFLLKGEEGSILKNINISGQINCVDTRYGLVAGLVASTNGDVENCKNYITIDNKGTSTNIKIRRSYRRIFR